MAESEPTASPSVNDANDDHSHCFFLSETMTQKHADGSRHFYPAMVCENEPGYYLTDWDYGTDFELAKHAVDSLNHKRGIPPDVVSRIVISSMFPKAFRSYRARPAACQQEAPRMNTPDRNGHDDDGEPR